MRGSIINRRDALKLEVEQMRFLRQLSGLTKLQREINTGIRNRSKANNQIEDIKLYQRSGFDRRERMDRSHFPNLAFQYQPRGRREIERPWKRWKDKQSFKGTILFELRKIDTYKA
jgi:hypothetical protein